MRLTAAILSGVLFAAFAVYGLLEYALPWSGELKEVQVAFLTAVVAFLTATGSAGVVIAGVVFNARESKRAKERELRQRRLAIAQAIAGESDALQVFVRGEINRIKEYIETVTKRTEWVNGDIFYYNKMINISLPETTMFDRLAESIGQLPARLVAKIAYTYALYKSELGDSVRIYAIHDGAGQATVIAAAETRRDRLQAVADAFTHLARTLGVYDANSPDLHAPSSLSSGATEPAAGIDGHPSQSSDRSSA